MPPEPTGNGDLTDEPAERDAPAAEPAEPPITGVADGGPPDLANRRAFMRQLSGDAVASAGRIAGLSSVFRRTVLAAGLAATRELQQTEAVDPDVGDRPQVPAPAPSVPAPAPSIPAPAPSADLPARASTAGGASATTAPLADAVAALIPEQHDFLARGTRAVLAVNDPAGAPHLSASTYDWDGVILRLPSRMFAARAEHVDRDPRVTVYIEERSTGAWVAVTGIASIVYGVTVEAEVRHVLAQDDPDGATHAGWAELASRSDAVVIRVRPNRFLWRPG